MPYCSSRLTREPSHVIRPISNPCTKYGHAASFANRLLMISRRRSCHPFDPNIGCGHLSPTTGAPCRSGVSSGYGSVSGSPHETETLVASAVDHDPARWPGTLESRLSAPAPLDSAADDTRIADDTDPTGYSGSSCQDAAGEPQLGAPLRPIKTRTQRQCVVSFRGVAWHWATSGACPKVRDVASRTAVLSDP